MQRPALNLANILRSRERHIHRPDEHRAVSLLQRVVKAWVVPESGTDPHQAYALIRADGRSNTHALGYLVSEAGRVRHRPVGAAMPLRYHGIRHLVGVRYGTRTRRADQACRLGEVRLLLVDPLHEVSETLLVKLTAGLLFQQCDQVAHFRDQQLDPARLVDLLPGLRGGLEPLRLFVLPGRCLERKELGAERRGPLPENLLNTI